MVAPQRLEQTNKIKLFSSVHTVERMKTFLLLFFDEVFILFALASVVCLMGISQVRIDSSFPKQEKGGKNIPPILS